MNLLSRFPTLRPAIVTAGLTAAFVAVLLVVRAFGLLVPLELLAYDLGVRLRAGSEVDRRIVLVTRTEEDLRKFGYPTSDATLAELLDRLVSSKAGAIGVDIYRDTSVPPGKERLEDLLAHHRNIVWVMKFVERDGHAVAPPAVLAKSDNQVGFNDLLDDPGGVVRRGLLVLDDGKTSAYSFALQLALAILEPSGKRLQPDAKVPEILRLGDTSIPPFEKDDGGYVNADAAGYQFLLDFSGASGRFTRHSFEDVLSGEAPAAAFAGRIVIVGTEAKSINDSFYTPLSAALDGDQRMLGAELHGHIASQLLRFAEGSARPLVIFGEGSEIAWIAAMGLLGAAIGFASRTLGRFALGLLVAAAWIVGASYALFLLGVWMPVAAPLIGCVVSLTLASGYASQHERAQKAQIMRLFSQHVSKEIAEELWRRRDDLLEHGRPRPLALTATVLFTDLEGFTGISEKLPAKELFDWLNEYMEEMSGLVVAHHGVVNKYVGDAVMAVFGVPFPRGSEGEIAADACNAVACALEMERVLDALNRKWSARGAAMVRMRVGIFTGPLVAGCLGGSERLEYTVIGDTVNTASRLESAGKTIDVREAALRSCCITIGESTRRLVGDTVPLRPVGAVELKGKEQKIQAYYVLRKQPSGAEPARGQT